MKKTVCILLSLIFAFSLVACRNGADDSANRSTANLSSAVTNSAANQAETLADEKVLVIYYSATGSTKAVAETIADALAADIFEITPARPYTSDDLDWTNENSRVSVEHNDESRRNVPLAKAAVDNWEQYETVYIGYPIWWGIAAWPVSSFIAANDFTGKTVIPFCTSASSELGNSAELLKDTAGSGSWLAGKRFSSNASKQEVAEWLNEV